MTERVNDFGDYAVPITNTLLSIQACRLVPRRIGPLSQPTKIRGIVQQYPHWLSQCTGQMRHGGIDGYHKIHQGNQCSRICEVTLVILV
jgi:hypothetical protein